MNLLIVESPKKTKLLKKLLGSDWDVIASFGHFRDLPDDSMGVSAPDFIPEYVISTSSKKNIALMRKKVKQSSMIYLATDSDREGEAISWHLMEVLKLSRSKYERVTFNEITKTAVTNALGNTRDINFNMVAAQEARRVVDRLVGYRVSPILYQLVKDKTVQGLSAGRVQSPGLRLVVEKENSISSFTSEKHYSIHASFLTDENNWEAKWDLTDFKDDDFLNDDGLLIDGNFAESIVDALNENNKFTVIDSNASKRKSKPHAPFITSTLQQGASSQLHLAPEVTMEYAQELFSLGLITYHRTDNPNLSEDGINMVRQWLLNTADNDINLSMLFTESVNTWKAPAGSEEAHEAIRPTSLDKLYLDEANKKLEPLYHLIFTRTVACQMADAVFDVRQMRLLSPLSISDNNIVFQAKGSTLVFTGWKSADLIFKQPDLKDTDDDNESDEDSDNSITLLSIGNEIIAESCFAKDHNTRPPSRFTEATLIGALEKLGIGRPSTYASILAILKSRKFIQIKKRKLHASKLGIEICNCLIGNFNFIELEFTRLFEETLDKVSNGNILYRPVVARMNELLSDELKAAGVKEFTPLDLTNNEPCPKCKKGKLIQRSYKDGVFWGCSRFKKYKCKVFINDDNGSPDINSYLKKNKK